MGKMKQQWANQSYEDSIDDYLYLKFIEEEKETKAQKKKEWIRFFYNNKETINKYRQEQKRSKKK